MRERTRPGLAPGMSVLGGAASGLSYEGALRDALGHEETARRAAGRRPQAGQGPTLPMQQQAGRAEPSPRDIAAARQMMA